ncbi:MAG: FAD-binding oxidoreductase [Candidatus Eremiobacteraeota bacterium]|nr:FAD-binding oxidoreductase [Candidatus Eremiobacteraeota bacterium]
MNAIERAAPGNVAEVGDLLAACDAEGKKVVIVGGNTLSGMGFPAERDDVTLETTRLAGVEDYQPADLTLSALGGTVLQSLSVLLAQHEQFVPFDAPRPQYATLGGTLAAGWLGPRRHLYGRPRDYVIGSTVVLADGTVARAGGMVVKNVAGYDMSRLYVGSFGTLAVIVRANLKTLASSRRARVFLARLPEGTRSRAFAHLAALKIRPAAAFWIEGFHQSVDGDEGDEGRMLILLETSNALLERATRDLRSALGGAGVPETRVVDAGARESFQRVVDAYVANLGERSVTYRFDVQAERFEATVAGIAALASNFGLRCETILDLPNGDLIARISALDMHALGAKIERFDDALHDAHPAARVIASEHAHRAYLRVWGSSPTSVEQMRALKMRFDPNRTLNPGRFVGGI